MPKAKHGITGEMFRAWQAGMGLSNRAAATQLGMSPNSIKGLRDNGASRTVALAMRSIAEGMGPWGEDGAAIRPNTKARAALRDVERALADLREVVG